MKKRFCLFLTLLMLFSTLSGLTAHAATGSLTASTSATSVTIGNSVTVTLKYDGGGATIGSLDAQFRYNAKSFEYLSCAGATANGNAGVVNISYFATGNAPSALTITLNFKAIAAGAGDFSVATSEFTNDNDYTSLGTPSKSLAVSAMNPTKSGNANLASIRPSSGTLTPAFKADVTSYTIVVPYTTTSLSLSVTTQDKNANTAVSGKNALSVGQNTQVITVTAPNGTTKKYTVVITRSPNLTTTTTQKKPTTTKKITTTTQPEIQPLEVEVNGVLMHVSDTQPSAALPQGFAWKSIVINDINVSAAYNEAASITLVYLKNPADNTAAFHIYDEATSLFHPFRSLTVSGGEYILRELPADFGRPVGTVVGEYTFGETAHTVYTFEDSALADIVLVYATAPNGKTGLYSYDITDKSMQLYREITVQADTTPTTTTTQPATGFSGFVTQNRTVILICAAALGGLALLIAAVTMLLMLTTRDKDAKH